MGPANNYALSTGPNVAWTIDPREVIGIMHVRVHRSLRHIRDGASHTILAAEIIRGDNDASKFSAGDVVRGVTWNISRIKPTESELEAHDQQCQTSYSIDHHYSDTGTWHQPHPLDTLFNTVATANSRFVNCVQQLIEHDTDGPGVFPSRSQHVGGTFHAMCDVSVRYISDDITHQLYQDLGSIAGGEVLAEF